MKKILICFGTRPEYIKVQSLINNFPKNIIMTLFTGQHEDLLENIKTDYKLKIKEINKNRLNNIIASILSYDDIFDEVEFVIVQGDTTSAMAIALSAYHNNKKIIHLEAGLRTNNIYDPYPEELNRQIISRIAYIHLCPTIYNKNNLLKENITDRIYVTGNTGLDNIDKKDCIYGNIVLITMHRRDNYNLISEWFTTLSKIAKKYKELKFIIPLHPNPKIRKYKNLLKGIKIIKSIEHDNLIKLLKKCKFIISDSGGLQEEASFLNKRIIVCRRTNERPESLGKLSNHSILCPYPKYLEEIVDKINNNYIIKEECPYGDGKAWMKIKEILKIN